MATSERQQLIWKLEKKLSGLDFEQLKTVACEIGKFEEEWMKKTATMNETEVFKLIVDFVGSEKLKDSEDEGMSQLLFVFDVIKNLLKGTYTTDPDQEDRDVDSYSDACFQGSKGSTSSDVSAQGGTNELLQPLDSSVVTQAKMTSSKFGHITSEVKPGSPTIYHLTPKTETAGSLQKRTFGKRIPNMGNKTILLVGGTGTGKTTLINALMNHAVGVKWEDNLWFQFIEEEQRTQAESQTLDVVRYQLFGFEGKALPYSLTIIDTPGYGSTEDDKKDSIVSLRLLELFRSGDGVHEISAVGLVLKASDNRVSERLRYIFDSVMSLFGKDMEKNIVALITHSDGLDCENVLQALEEANIKLARDEDNEPVHFKFNNRQSKQRTKKETSALKAVWEMTVSEMNQFREFVDNRSPQDMKKTVEVLDTRVKLKACIQNLKERIEWTEMQQREIQQTEEALKKHEQEMEKNKDFSIETDEPYKEKGNVEGGWWFRGLFYEGAVTCTVCEENCHYPGCTWAPTPKRCEVMKKDHCTSCSGKCHVSKHVKEEWIYVNKTTRVETTILELKAKYEVNKAEKDSKSNLLENLKKKMQKLQKEKDQFLEESFLHIVRLEEIALNDNSLLTLVHLDFLIEKMKEKGDSEKLKKLEKIKSRIDKVKGVRAALKYGFDRLTAAVGSKFGF